MFSWSCLEKDSLLKNMEVQSDNTYHKQTQQSPRITQRKHVFLTSFRGIINQAVMCTWCTVSCGPGVLSGGKAGKNTHRLDAILIFVLHNFPPKRQTNKKQFGQLSGARGL